MKATMLRRLPRALLSFAVAAGMAAAISLTREVGAAPPASEDSAAPASSESAPAKGAPSVSAYTWPSEAGAEPKEEEWAGATDLGTVEVTSAPPFSWIHLSCTQRALGAWVRVTCSSPNIGDTLFGAIWPLAGDVAKVKGAVSLASELARYQKPPTSIGEDLTRKMGASATITFPVTPGSALLLRIDSIDWDEGYEGGNVYTHPGVLVDVSWALGEKAPTIVYR